MSIKKCKKYNEPNGFILSSLWEGLPLTPIEAFSVGKTIIATEVIDCVAVRIMRFDYKKIPSLSHASRYKKYKIINFPYDVDECIINDTNTKK